MMKINDILLEEIYQILESGDISYFRRLGGSIIYESSDITVRFYQKLERIIVEFTNVPTLEVSTNFLQRLKLKREFKKFTKMFKKYETEEQLKLEYEYLPERLKTKLNLNNL